MHASALSAIASEYLNSDPGCAEALSSAVFPSANYTVFVGNASAHNTLVANFNGASDIYASAFTIPATVAFEAWINGAAFSASPTGSQIIGVSDPSTTNSEFMFVYPSGSNRYLGLFEYTGAGNYQEWSGGINLNTGVWYDVVAVQSGVGVTPAFYVNGVQDTTTLIASGGTVSGRNTQPLEIGMLGSGLWYFDGIISNAQVYGTALSASQVQSIYQRGVSGLPISNAGLTGWWPLQGDTNDYANFNTGYNNGVTFVSKNYTAPSLANAYSISQSSVLIPLLNYSSGADNVIKAGVYTWK